MALVSIITPAYNAAPFIGTAIESVLTQQWSNWEMIVIDDGSIDDTAKIVKQFADSRIRYFYQENRGVSAARNYGLGLMQGDFMLFLDADDALTEDSISSRMPILLNDNSVYAVDGCIAILDENLDAQQRRWCPDYQGKPLDELVALSGRCFFNPSWLMRCNPSVKLCFDEKMSHAEDLWFLIEHYGDKKYTYVDNTVLKYRRHGASAMSNLSALEKGYLSLYRHLADSQLMSTDQARFLRDRITRIMWRSYARNGQLFQAFRVLINKKF
ncbi:MAG: glycosyltransferase family 2 protein [Methylobacter sp.]